MMSLLIGILLIVGHVNGTADDDDFTSDSRQCKNDSCIRTDTIQYGNCQFDQLTGVCIPNDKQLHSNCTAMVNSGNEKILQACGDPKGLYDIRSLGANFDFLKFMAIIPHQSSYCFVDRETETNIYAGFCESACKGTCNPDTKKCECDPQHVIGAFSAKKMLKNQRKVKEEKHLLLAIDGTGSKDQFEDGKRQGKKYKSRIGVKTDELWIWQSHVANFWEDYQGRARYWYGPDNRLPYEAGGECRKLRKKGFDVACEFLQELYEKKQIQLDDDQKNIIGDYFIDIIGYSRGGYIAMEIARSLQIQGCPLGDTQIIPIPVNWLGLYDPVRMVEDGHHGHQKHAIGPYVQNVSIAERCRTIKSRWFWDTVAKFRYATDGGCENPDYNINHGTDKSPCNQYTKHEFKDTSHAGIGGTPGQGDCKDDCPSFFEHPVQRLVDDCQGCQKRGYTERKDKEASLQVDVWMRNNAVVNNVPIRPTTREYYQPPGDPDAEIFVEYSE